MASQYIIEILDKKKHEIKHFRCGVQELDTYIKEKAGQEMKKHVSSVYVLRKHHSKSAIGFYTISSSSVSLRALPDSIAKKIPRYPSVPTVLLGRLAVDLSWRGQGIGKYLLIDALKRSLLLSKNIGIHAVIVDAKNEKIREFYEKYGFIQLQKKPLTLFLPIHTIKTLFQSS